MRTRSIQRSAAPSCLSALLVALFAFAASWPTSALAQDDTDDSDVPYAIMIGSFNIQNLGPAKRGRPAVMRRLAEIIREYDVIAVQEVTDVSERAPRMLLDYINADGSGYAMALSPRTGVQPDDRTSQEQYAFYYDTGRVTLLRDLGLFDDSEDDQFQREPHAALFHTNLGDFEFALVNIHTPPSRALAEIDALADVADWVLDEELGGEGTVIVLGDFNGDCTYASPEDLDALPIRQAPYIWIIPDTADSTLSRTHCAYDRIVLTDDAYFTGYADVWQAFDDDGISDHWPIWAQFWVERP
jgi:endonuclease/exonuclease/phosphatase family metal-dependent hydrolase